MKYLSYIGYVYISGMFFLSLSCKKYLDKKSNSSLVVPSRIEDLQALLDNDSHINFRTSNFIETSSDDYFVLESTYGSQGVPARSAYTWTSFDYNYPNDWSAGYLPIYYSNLCLEIIESIPRTTQNAESWDNVKGSAHFIRAYYFLNLAWAYSKAYDQNTAESDLGICLRLNSDFNIPSTRANVQATYDRIIADAQASIQYLKPTPQHVMRPSQSAAYGLLARTYLSMRKYDSAFKYSDLCLSIKGDLLNFNTDITVTSPTPMPKWNKETIFYSEPFTQFLPIINASNPKIDTTLYSSYVSYDLRKKAYFAALSGYQRFKGHYTQGTNRFTGIATDEMYLTRAECYARLDNKEAALSDLNKLLQNRHDKNFFAPITAATSQVALNTIILERRKELLMRSLRWIDIKRLNKENINIIPKRIIGGQEYILAPNGNKYALPLPKDIIQQGGLQQN